MSDLGSLLRTIGRRYGDSTALVFGDRRWSYRTLAERVELAGSCIATYAQPGDRVVIVAPNSDDLVFAILGCCAFGLIAVPIQSDTPRSRLLAILNDAEPALLVHHNGAGIVDTGWKGRCETLERLTAAGPSTPASRTVPVRPDQPAVLLYTSGTTRAARGVVLTHGQLMFTACAINTVLRHTPSDVIVSDRPLPFGYGLHQLLTAINAGATLVLSADATPASLAHLLDRKGATGLPLSPAGVAMMLSSRVFERCKPHALRYLTSSGDTLASAHVAALRRLLPATAIVPMYGLTECGRVAMTPLDDERHEGCVGLPLPGTQVRVVATDPATLSADLGELRVHGPHVAAGYWRAEQLTNKRFAVDPVDGRRECRTGDLFRRHADGYLEFVGRTDGFIKSYGERVSPAEVEAALLEYPGVVESAVVGAANAVSGETVVAFIVTDGSGVDLRKLREHCARHLTTAARPGRFVLQAEPLPRTLTGKIDRAVLGRSLVRAASTPRREQRVSPTAMDGTTSARGE